MDKASVTGSIPSHVQVLEPSRAAPSDELFTPPAPKNAGIINDILLLDAGRSAFPSDPWWTDKLLAVIAKLDPGLEENLGMYNAAIENFLRRDVPLSIDMVEEFIAEGKTFWPDLVMNKQYIQQFGLAIRHSESIFVPSTDLERFLVFVHNKLPKWIQETVTTSAGSLTIPDPAYVRIFNEILSDFDLYRETEKQPASSKTSDADKKLIDAVIKRHKASLEYVNEQKEAVNSEIGGGEKYVGRSSREIIAQFADRTDVDSNIMCMRELTHYLWNTQMGIIDQLAKDVANVVEILEKYQISSRASQAAEDD